MSIAGSASMIRSTLVPGLMLESRAEPERSDLQSRGRRVRHGFRVNRQVIGPGARERVDEAERLDDHEVNVERKRGEPAHGFDQHRPEGEVGYELPVHHVDVEKVRSRALDAGDLFAQAGEVGRENRRTEPHLRGTGPRGGGVGSGTRLRHGW